MINLTEITCDSHDDCPADYPFCYDGLCDLCSECQYCQDGIDGTCGSCGDGYPTRESGDCTGTTEPTASIGSAETTGNVTNLLDKSSKTV